MIDFEFFQNSENIRLTRKQQESFSYSEPYSFHHDMSNTWALNFTSFNSLTPPSNQTNEFQQIEEAKILKNKPVLTKKTNRRNQLKVRKIIVQQKPSNKQNQILQNEALSSKIRQIINLCIKFSSDIKILRQQGNFLISQDQQLKEVFEIFINRFKKGNKSKQQLIKFCMRKAFKFIVEKYHCHHIGDTTKTKQYILDYYQFIGNSQLSVPFKSDNMKTMNKTFLNKIFSSPIFLTDYKQFLESFVQTAENNNIKKIQQLIDITIYNIKKGTISNLQTVTKLPWVQTSILESYLVAQQLLAFSPEYKNIIQVPKRKNVRKAEPTSKTPRKYIKIAHLLRNNIIQNIQNNQTLIKYYIPNQTKCNRIEEIPHIIQDVDYQIQSMYFTQQTP